MVVVLIALTVAVVVKVVFPYRAAQRLQEGQAGNSATLDDSDGIADGSADKAGWNSGKTPDELRNTKS